MNLRKLIVLKFTIGKIGPRAKSLRGVTLIEILTAMAVLTIVVAAMTSLFSNANRIWNDSMKNVETFEDAMFAMDLMRRDFVEMIYSPYDAVYTYTAGDIYDVDGLNNGTLSYPLSQITFNKVSAEGLYQVGYKIDINGTANYFSDDKLERLYKSGTFEDPSGSWSATQDIAYAVKAMMLYFYDERDSTWSNTWSSYTDGGMPAAIRVEMHCLSDADAKKANGDNALMMDLSKKFVSEIYLRNTRGD
ncbi:MAG: prepilin-type N-terminal cleavage/methylation domain-containing protein [Candidatus Aureabacteria bacterium]|nr:prepilin-type N-terminal cleavage/methylation domain-containing protein [Candidatus Auribacterota bacterium]